MQNMAVAQDFSWGTQFFRQTVRVKIEAAIHQNGNPTTKSLAELENHVFQKAKSREEYIGLVARLIIYIREMNENRYPNVARRFFDTFADPIDRYPMDIPLNFEEVLGRKRPVEMNDTDPSTSVGDAHSVDTTSSPQRKKRFLKDAASENAIESVLDTQDAIVGLLSDLNENLRKSMDSNKEMANNVEVKLDRLAQSVDALNETIGKYVTINSTSSTQAIKIEL